MKKKSDIKGIIEILNEIKEDETLPKNTKQKLKTTVRVLEDCKDVTVTIDKTIQEIESAKTVLLNAGNKLNLD